MKMFWKDWIIVVTIICLPLILYNYSKNRVKNPPQVPEGWYEFHCVTKYGSMSCRPMHESMEDLRGSIKFEGEE